MDWIHEHLDRKVRYDRTAYHLSAAYGRTECLKFLKEEAPVLWNKLSVSKEVKDFNYFDPLASDDKGRTPLHWAVFNNKANTIPSLLSIDDGKMLNAQDNSGLSALHIASSSHKYLECFKILLEKGADLDLKENYSVKKFYFIDFIFIIILIFNYFFFNFFWFIFFFHFYFFFE